MATTNASTTKLTDAQRAVLTAATSRSDLSVILPARLKGKAAEKLAQALLDKGLVREMRAKGEQPVWRKDTDTGRSFSLVLTKAGRTLGAGPAEGDQPPASRPSSAVAFASSTASALAVPRQGSKLAAVIALLGREQGTSVPEVMAATGWLPHTTRAALTGLRKRGYALTREAREGGPVYRIGTAPAAAA